MRDKNKVSTKFFAVTAILVTTALVISLTSCKQPADKTPVESTSTSTPIASSTPPETGTALPSQANPGTTTDSPVTFFPVQTEKYANEPYPLALARGTLVLDAGCLRLSHMFATGFIESDLLVWPPGFSVRSENGVIVILDRSGEEVARTGDALEVGGGQVTADIVEKYTEQSVPADVPGPYWLVSQVISRYPPSPSSVKIDDKWQIGVGWHYGQQAVYEDRLVAQEFILDEHYNVTGWYVSLYDLSTREKRRLFEIPSDRIFGELSIYGEKIVWSSLDRAQVEQQPAPKNFDILNWDVFLYDFTTGETRQLTTEVHAQVHPRIYGDTVVWMDNRHTDTDLYPQPYDIFTLDLKTGQERRITSSTTVEGYSTIGISGNIVVWTDMRHTDPQVTSHPSNSGDYDNELYIFDLVTGEEHRITTNPANDHEPTIDGTRIVWLRQVDYNRADVFVYDLVLGREVQVSQSGYAAGSPSVNGNHIVWQDARVSQGNTMNDVIMNGQTGAADIYLYDMLTSTEIKLTSEDGQGNRLWAAPLIGGNYVIYSLDRQIGPVAYAIRLTGE
jgi:beta propeller repeat protein